MSMFGARRKPFLYLHVGFREAGHREIQRTLSRHRAALAAAGVVYPVAGSDAESGHHALARLCGFAPSRKDDPSIGDLASAWAREMDAAPPGSIGVVSSELLTRPGGDPARVVEALSPLFELRAVVTVRRHDLWLPAIYEAAVRSHNSPPWGRGYEAFMRFRLSSADAKAEKIKPLVEGWAGPLGRAQVLVRPYEATQWAGGDAVRDLLHAVQAPAAAIAALPPGAGAAARSLSFEALNLVDIIQQTDLPAAVKRQLAARAVARDDGKMRDVALASPGFRAGQIAANYDDYEHLAHRYLNREDGRLFLESTPSDETGAAAWKPTPPFTNIWMAARLCRLMAECGESGIEAMGEWPGTAN